eukprot:Opistho-2@66678
MLPELPEVAPRPPYTIAYVDLCDEILHEALGDTQITIKLDGVPSSRSNVTLVPVQEDGLVTFDPPEVTFSHSNFQIPQTVTLRYAAPGKGIINLTSPDLTSRELLVKNAHTIETVPAPTLDARTRGLVMIQGCPSVGIRISISARPTHTLIIRLSCMDVAADPEPSVIEFEPEDWHHVRRARVNYRRRDKTKGGDKFMGRGGKDDDSSGKLVIVADHTHGNYYGITTTVDMPPSITLMTHAKTIERGLDESMGAGSLTGQELEEIDAGAIAVDAELSLTSETPGEQFDEDLTPLAARFEYEELLLEETRGEISVRVALSRDLIGPVALEAICSGDVSAMVVSPMRLEFARGGPLVKTITLKYVSGPSLASVSLLPVPLGPDAETGEEDGVLSTNTLMVETVPRAPRPFFIFPGDDTNSVKDEPAPQIAAEKSVLALESGSSVDVAVDEGTTASPQKSAQDIPALVTSDVSVNQTQPQPQPQPQPQ